MEEKIAGLEHNLNNVSNELVALKSLITTVLTKVQSNFSVVDYKLNGLDKKINEVNYKLEHLDHNTTTGLTDVGTKIESLTEEITKISTVTGYDEVYKNAIGL